MNIQLLDNIAFKALIENTQYINSFEPSFFEEKIKQILFKHAKEHYDKFQEAPSKDQLKEIYRISNIGADNSMVNNYIDILYKIDLNNYTKEWLDKALQSFISIKKLDKSVQDLLVYLKTTSITMENVDNVLQDSRNIITNGTDLNFNIDLGANIFNPESYKMHETFKIPSGYDFIDKVTNGGFSRPGLHIFAAAPKIGKCLAANTLIKVKNKKTGKILKISMDDFYNLLKNTSNVNKQIN